MEEPAAQFPPNHLLATTGLCITILLDDEGHFAFTKESHAALLLLTIKKFGI
ncbi:MAG: hypothetical protein HYW48_10780 [Deltaproteobacteria bacterium]|nr:hypothetical protein [Deltaproteobacteria bacterium]